ncbi:MAG: CBS domain-containing protein [Alphaproteobacteria bacterium]|nr:CBS domain-containing protein [Alphaproteobacteria bacterium]
MQTRTMSEVVRDRRPITLPGSATVQEACKLMRTHRIGAVLVTTPEGGLEGIFTGRDAVRLLADGQKGATGTRLHAVMTHRPEVAAPHHKAIEVLRLMQDGGFRHVPVVENGKVVGIASVGDFRAVEHARLDEETGFWERI